MAPTPAGLLIDSPPASSIFDVAHPMSDLPGVGGQDDWARGVALHYRTGSAARWRHSTMFDGSDTDIAAITDPTVWPDAVSVEDAISNDVLASFPYGIKGEAAEARSVIFRSFTVYAPRLLVDLVQANADAATQAEAHLAAHAAGQVSAELVDSLYTLNPGLSRSATDVSGASAVDLAVAIGTLYEAHGNAFGNGDCVLHVPYQALPMLFARSLVRWDGNILRDVYRNPVHFAPTFKGRGPVTGATNLETTDAPGSGNGYLYLSPPVFAGVGAYRSSVESLSDGPRGTYARSNEQVALAEAPAIVLFKPDRVYTCLASINEVV